MCINYYTTNYLGQHGFVPIAHTIKFQKSEELQ